MKILNVALLVCAFPSLSHADRLVYPDAPVQVVKNVSLNNDPSLQAAFDALGFNLKAEDFVLREVKQSLLGTHYDYQQVLNGHEVVDSHVVITVDGNGRLVKAFNAAVKVGDDTPEASVPFVSRDMALRLAWNKLQVNGELMNMPKSELVYSKNLNLVYNFDLSVSSPFGHWKVIVDAHDGTVLEVKDAALPRMKRAGPVFRLKGAKMTSLTEALKAVERKSVENFLNEPALLVNGTAQIFDPNPVVTLGRTDLNDSMEGSVFTHAYKKEELKEISFAKGKYNLTGPKVTLADFEGPNVAPATSTDGSWIFERKDLAFDDAMTYLHIDRSIRYIESLGFKGSKVIFPKSIEVDANGVNGADNSHYVPSTLQLAFGHGCVDDNEDSDVILHELGHAIQHHIVSSWGGGDSGAIGEGFGDYWAASYSYTTERGTETNPNWVFKWDGHNACWPGRKLNAFTPTYSASQSYWAHAQVNGGISDELWSTPVFQAFVELYTSGVPRGDIDKIILESHFGLGYGVKMPDMAKSIVKAAKALFPNKNYDQVYLRHFTKQKIL